MKITKKKWYNISKILLVFCLILMQACQTYYFRKNYSDTNRLLYETSRIETKRYLKGHLKNGDICIFRDSWDVDTVNYLLTGNGSRYDFNRNKVCEGSFSVPLDSVVLFETNKKLLNTEKERIRVLTFLAVGDVALGLFCLTNPKACFGSCPTFYLNEDDNFHYANAEGFTDAILPSLEYADVDALNINSSTTGSFSITMKNEALETHCISELKLLAIPREADERIYHSPEDEFYLCKNIYKPNEAVGPEGNIVPLLQNDDILERFSLSDENNLCSKEELFLSFSDVQNTQNLGLLLGFRQTLMTTYLIYNAMGYMGDRVGDFLAKVETGTESKEKINRIKKELGYITIYAWLESKNSWECQGSFYETGPIAINHQIMPLSLPASSSEIRLKIVLNKGLWRIDYANLTQIKSKANPIAIEPDDAFYKGQADQTILTKVNSSDKYLISMPGSEYKFHFTLPVESQDYEIFLYSKGYYLEWMREEWTKDKNFVKLNQMLNNTAKYLREEAVLYKQYEKEMEQQFWESRIDTKSFSYYEN